MKDLETTIINAQRRVTTARGIADQLRKDDRLHRLAMQTVFALEDVLFTLRQTAAGAGGVDTPMMDPQL